MRLAVVLLAAAALSACAGSAPTAAAPPGRLPAPRSPAPIVRPAPLPERPAAVLVEPAPPRAAPRGTVALRSYYPEADVTEWILTTGATVVFKPLPNGAAVDLLAFRRTADPASLMPCEARTEGRLPTDSLDGLFDTSLGGRAVYVVVGDARPGEVEQAAARLLTRPDAPLRCASASGSQAYTVEAAPESDATFAVLVELLVGPARATRDAWTGTTTLHTDASLAALRPTAASVAAARAAVAEQRAESPAFWAEALADLYRTEGEIRPSRDPAFVSDFASRVARVTERAVTELAARLAASPN